MASDIYKENAVLKLGVQRRADKSTLVMMSGAGCRPSDKEVRTNDAMPYLRWHRKR